MRFALASLSGFVSASMTDDAVLLAVSSRESLGGQSGLSSLIDLAQEGSPRKAQQLLQQFAMNTLVRGEAVDNSTKQKLKEIGEQLTNNTWMSLEQQHRHDQDLLDMHWQAIKDCGDKHIALLRQDVDGWELQQVRTHESDMLKCRGLTGQVRDRWVTHEGARSAAEAACVKKHGEEWCSAQLACVKEHGEVWCSAQLAAAACVKKHGEEGCSAQLRAAAEAEKNTELSENDDAFEYTPFAIREFAGDKDEHGNVQDRHQRYFTDVSGMYNDVNGEHYYRNHSLLHIKNELCDVCGELDAFLKGLQAAKPTCELPLIDKQQDPKCTTADTSLIETELNDWFNNLVHFSEANLEKWQNLKTACKELREKYKDKDEHCDEEQWQYEGSFCEYRMNLHSTCAEYQGCHILQEEEYKDLITDVLYAADSRKIDWKAIHKIACYIKVLISDGTNEDRTKALENCESGNLNTLANILTGFTETNYLSIIIPEISGNVSCWDMEVPPLIDFKECDMSSVNNFPCTETWMDRYNGLESPGNCLACTDLPEHMQYSDNDYQGTTHHRNSEYGGGWIFVNELGRSSEDINNLVVIQPDGYILPRYNMKGLRYNEVLIERVSDNWCDSWGKQSSKWVEDGGASMCVQADNDHVYCMSNHNGEHTWRQQPTTHFAALCNKDGVGACECWPFTEGDHGQLTGKSRADNVCFAHNKSATGPTQKNVPAPDHVTIHSLAKDGSVVKVSFRGEEKRQVLRVGNYGAFLDGVGCSAATPVSYRVFVRCLGCVTERTDFHTKDGAQFTGVMNMAARFGKTERDDDQYTYEAWFRSPLNGKFRRELFGGVTDGLFLTSEGHANCYRLHLGNTNVHSTTCFRKDLMYHVAVIKERHSVHVFVNGKEEFQGHRNLAVRASDFARSFGGGFTDGGQLFNVRIWNVARSPEDLIASAAVTDVNLREDHMELGLEHWWPLTNNIQDVITGTPLTGSEVRYAPVYCSDLEATGMLVC